MNKNIEKRLSGGHPNSLGETVSVTEDVLKDDSQKLMNELCATYCSDDEVVRLRVSSALKRVCGLHRNSLSPSSTPRPDWVLNRFDWLINDVGYNIDQPSSKWSIAQIVQKLKKELNDKQKDGAIELLKHNLETENDWIVQCSTAETLTDFAKQDEELKHWLIPRLQKMKTDDRNSVAKKAIKLLDTLQ